MKVIEKKSLSKTQWLTIILSSAFVLLLAASIVLSIILAKLNAKQNETALPDVRTELGESDYSGSPIVYERIEEAQISYLLVENKYGKFDLTRWEGVFWLSYGKAGDSTGEMTTYIPPIMDIEGNFNYESLYAVENSDGYGQMYMLSYLCSAIGTPYFTQRIEDLPAGERDLLMKEYGLAGEGVTPTVVHFNYGLKDENGKLTGEMASHKITIGGPALNGEGHYFMVDDREQIYYSKYSHFKYAELGFESYVKGSLVAAGLAEDKSFEPLLTNNFTEWRNTMHSTGNVELGSTVIAKGNVLDPIRESAGYDPTKNEGYLDGYRNSSQNDLKFDLKELADHHDYERIKAALVGVGVSGRDADGNVLSLSEPVLLTLLSDIYGSVDTLIDFSAKESVNYTYKISRIEAILDYRQGSATVENVTAGTAVGEANLIRVTFTYEIDGEAVGTVPSHGVIELDSLLLPDAARTALKAASVGEDLNITFDVTYTKENSVAVSDKMMVSEIVAIYDPVGQKISKVAEDSYVMIKTYQIIDGEKGEIYTRTVSMQDVKNDAKLSGLYGELLGKKVSKKLEIVAYETVEYHELMRDFVSYEITAIEGYLTSEEIVSFSFLNASKRDPFYGESIYENLTGRYELYGVDADMCQNVLRIVGGLSEDTTASTGLSGTTVAVGLTNENMYKYHLYANTIYFELPRGIYSEVVGTDESGEEVEDYDYQHSIGFTLYISEEMVDEYGARIRYVGSDVYDVVAAVSADTFVFLEYDFVDFWARRNMIMLEIDNVDDFKIEFFMSDVTGAYDFDFEVNTYYVKNGDPVVRTEPAEGYSAQEQMKVTVTPSGDIMTNTALYKYLTNPDNAASGGKVAIHDLYGGAYLGSNTIEYKGVSNFLLAFQVMQRTSYEGSLSAAEQAKANEGNLLMRITLGLDAENASTQDYVYEFYRISDRKILVKTYQLNTNGQPANGYVSDFYISTASFKKMVNAYLTVFNAGEVDGEIAYVDEAAAR